MDPGTEIIIDENWHSCPDITLFTFLVFLLPLILLIIFLINFIGKKTFKSWPTTPLRQDLLSILVPSAIFYFLFFKEVVELIQSKSYEYIGVNPLIALFLIPFIVFFVLEVWRFARKKYSIFVALVVVAIVHVLLFYFSKLPFVPLKFPCF